jgi:hypothetical protein
MLGPKPSRGGSSAAANGTSIQAPFTAGPPCPYFAGVPSIGTPGNRGLGRRREARVLRLDRTAGREPAGAQPKVDPKKEVIPCLVPVVIPA